MCCVLCLRKLEECCGYCLLGVCVVSGVCCGVGVHYCVLWVVDVLGSAFWVCVLLCVLLYCCVCCVLCCGYVVCMYCIYL